MADQHQTQHGQPAKDENKAKDEKAKADDKSKAASTEEKKPEEKVVDKKEVKSLFESGHRLKKKGDPDNKWIAAVRISNTLCLAQPLDDELEKKVLGEELVLVTD